MTGDRDWDGHGGRAAVPARRGASDAPALRVEQLRLVTGSEPVDLALHEGEILGVIGLDGHGQAPFVQAVAWIAPAASGTITVVGPDGQTEIDQARTAADQGIAYVSGD